MTGKFNSSQTICLLNKVFKNSWEKGCLKNLFSPDYWLTWVHLTLILLVLFWLISRNADISIVYFLLSPSPTISSTLTSSFYRVLMRLNFYVNWFLINFDILPRIFLFIIHPSHIHFLIVLLAEIFSPDILH